MGWFDLFRRKSPQAAAAEGAIPFEQSCYDVAYFILPQYVFESFDRLIELCTQSPQAAGPFYYVMACQGRGCEPDIEIAKKFIWRTGDFDAQRKYLALEYPTPPPVDMGSSDPLTLLESGKKITLAPYFSVVVHGGTTEPEYYILGQAPIGGGTTVRSILKEGMNCNLGPGPAPKLDAFLAAIHQRQKTTQE